MKVKVLVVVMMMIVTVTVTWMVWLSIQVISLLLAVLLSAKIHSVPQIVILILLDMAAFNKTAVVFSITKALMRRLSASCREPSARPGGTR